MTVKTDILHAKIKKAQQQKPRKSVSKQVNGYQLFSSLMANLFACVLVAAALGYVVYKMFDTSVLVVAIFVIIGGIAGLYSFVKLVLSIEKKENEHV